MKKNHSNKNKLKRKSSSLRELPLIKIESVKLTKRFDKYEKSEKRERLNKKRQSLSHQPILRENTIANHHNHNKSNGDDQKLKLERRSNSLMNLNGDVNYQLDKRQRFEIYKRRLTIKPSAKNTEEAIELINKTLVEIEDKYAPDKDNKFYAINSKKYGRMYPVPNDRIRLNPETGITELLTVGLTIYVYNNGSFEIWTVPRGGNVNAKKIYSKNGAS